MANAYLRKAPGHSSWTSVFHYYKRREKDNNTMFSLTFEQFKILCSKNCYYCNAEPVIKNPCKSRKGCYPEWIKQQEIKVNGLDRVDNSKGYTLANVVPCCWKCNRMKAAYSQEEFLDHIKQIINNLVEVCNV